MCDQGSRKPGGRKSRAKRLTRTAPRHYLAAMAFAMTSKRPAAVPAALVLCAGCLLGCPEQQVEQPAGPKGDTSCPRDFPPSCKVFKDDTDQARNTIEYHVLVPAETKHDAAQKELESLYRHLMTRRESEPAGLFGYLYTSEAQYTTPPLSPVASVVKKPGDKGPTFENKIPLELWQQVEQALHLSDRHDRKLARKLTYAADPKTGKISITLPMTEGVQGEWAAQVTFLQVMDHFTNTAMAIFDNISDAKELAFVATWKDQEVARINLTRADYQKLQLHDIQDKIGSQFGRTFLELARGKGNEAAIDKAHQKRQADIYRKVLAELKGQAFIGTQVK